MIQYHIYGNVVPNGPIDYTTPMATTASLSSTSGPLASGIHQRIVRPFDTVTGYEDQNADARITIIIDAFGNDITNLPAAPVGLTVVQQAGGATRFHWVAGMGGGPPRRFDLYLGTPTPNYAVSRGSSAHLPMHAMFASVSGLTPGATYQAVVRASNGTGQEANTNTLTFTVPASGPNPVGSLTATAVP